MLAFELYWVERRHDYICQMSTFKPYETIKMYLCQPVRIIDRYL